MKVVIIKYNAGNIFSVDYALRRLGVEPIVTADKEIIRSADKVIFPGVGEAKTTADLHQPVLGICLGMQLMCNYSEEGNVQCLGIFNADVQRFTPERHEDKVPHMGWNTLCCKDNILFHGFDKEEFVYFVHSFYVPLNEFTAAQTNYILPFSSALHKNNFYATQFHPEKSGKIGERILQNFLERT